MASSGDVPHAPNEGGDDGPLRNGSTRVMHTDPSHPPTEFTHEEWVVLRDALYNLDPHRSVEHRIAREVGKMMNNIQHAYRGALRRVSGEGRRIAEAVCMVLSPKPSGHRGYWKLGDAIKGIRGHPICKALDILRKIGNDPKTGAHFGLGPLQVHLKVSVVHSVFRVATIQVNVPQSWAVFRKSRHTDVGKEGATIQVNVRQLWAVFRQSHHTDVCDVVALCT